MSLCLSCVSCVCVDCYVAIIEDIDVLECQAGVPADHCRLELQEFMAELPGQLHLRRGDREFGGPLRAQWRAVFEPGRVRQQQLRLQRRTTGSILRGRHFLVIVKHHACRLSWCVPHTLV